MIRTGIFGTGNTIKERCSEGGYLITGTFSHKPVLEIPPDKFSAHDFEIPEDLISGSEAIIISEKAGEYEDLIMKALKKSRHILIFPDTSLSTSQLQSFLKLAEEAGVLLFLFHKDLNNHIPSIIKSIYGKPEFIDVYRYLDNQDPLLQKSIFEIFYDEIFMLMRINPVNTRKYITTSIPYFSSNPHFLNVRIEFENGTSANVTVNKFEDGNKSRIDIYRNDSLATISPVSDGIKIIQKNPDKVEFIPYQTACPMDEGLAIFKNCLSSGDFKSGTAENGILAHRVAIEIVQQLAPAFSSHSVVIQ